jgi:hypothetical protein
MRCALTHPLIWLDALPLVHPQNKCRGAPALRTFDDLLSGQLPHVGIT